jgi:uracil-DNA glycosylase family 4
MNVQVGTPKQRVANQFPTFEIPGSPRVAIVGEAPSEDDVSYGRPFMGAAGGYLSKVLAASGLVRQTCFVGNVYQYGLGRGEKIERVSKTSWEWEASVSTLKSDLLKFDPDIIISLGEAPLQVLAEKKSISKWRGSIYPALGGAFKAVAAYHPSFILRNYALSPIFSFDIAKAAKESKIKGLNIPNRKCLINPSFAQAIEYLRYLESCDIVAMDFETTMGKAVPLCLGFAPTKDEAMCIPFGVYSEMEEFKLWQAIERFCKSPAKKVFANALFDVSVLLVHGKVVPSNVWMDVQYAWHACYPEFRKSLAFIASILTNQPYWKSMHKESEEDDNEKSWNANRVDKSKVWEYNCVDCCVTRELVEPLLKEMDELHATPGYEIDMAMMPIALWMTLKGIQINLDVARQGFLMLEKQQLAVMKLAEAAFGCPVNTKSPKQMKELLYEKLQMPVQYSGRGADKKVTTDAGALIALAQKGYQDVKLLLKNRQLRTQQAFFFVDWSPRPARMKPDEYELQKELVPDYETISHSFRIHAGFNPAGTKTGRWSSNSSIIGGRNILNIPDPDDGQEPYPRRQFQVDDGFVGFNFDQSAAEARIVGDKAWLVTGDSSYKEVLNGPIKIHLWLARKLVNRGVFRCPIEHIKSGTTEYYVSKKAVHSYSYGEQPGGFCNTIAKETDGGIILPVKQAAAIWDSINDDLPAIRKWQQAIEELLRNTAIMTTCFGRIGIFFERPGPDLFKKYYAFEPQSTVGDITARAMRNYWKIPYVQILQQNYDSVFFQVPKDLALKDGVLDMTLVRELKVCFEQPITLSSFDGTKKHTMTIPVGCKWGYNWQDMEEIKP